MVLAAGLVALLPGRASNAQTTAPSPSREPPRPPAVLLARGTPQPQRDEAARRLLVNQAGESRTILLTALKDGGHDVQLAVARALSDDPRVDPQFVNPLIGLLGGERALNEAAARALARYGQLPAAQSRLLGFARDTRQSTGLRASVIRALPMIVDKAVAATLVDLLNDPREATLIQNAAADGLTELTGLSDLGRDPAAWKRWFDANAARPNDAWRLSIYATRDTRLQDMAQRHARLVTELSSILSDQYQAAADKNVTVLRYMDASEPEIRAVGARIVRDAFLGGVAAPTDAQKARLTDLIGDSDARVRLEVARTLRAINYGGALNAMLAQLAQERDPDVKIALEGAVAQNGDVRAVLTLRRLLHDPSAAVARSAAEALRTLGPAIYAADRNTAESLARELWQTYVDHANDPASGDLQGALIDALAPLKESSLVLPLTRLLNPELPDRVRSAALRAMGELGDPNTDDPIRAWLAQEPEASVRLDALDALGKTGSFGADADALYGLFGPRNTEPDVTVRDKAWLVFQDLLPTAPKQLLSQWASRMLQEPAHRLPVLLELNRKLLQDRDLENLAISQENTGDTYMRLGKPDRAADYFRKALDYWQGQHAENLVTERLVSELMNALLQSRQYPEAAKFAQEMVNASRAQQQTMGSMFVHAAEGLLNASEQKPDGADSADALRLIDEVMKMKPPLDESYLEDLRNIQRQLKQKPPQ